MTTEGRKDLSCGPVNERKGREQQGRKEKRRNEREGKEKGKGEERNRIGRKDLS